MASDHSVTSDEDIEIDNYWRFIALSFKQADSVCIKLNELIRRGKIDKSKILYKFLSDVVEISLTHIILMIQMLWSSSTPFPTLVVVEHIVLFGVRCFRV